MPIPIQTAPFLQLSANRHRVSTDQGLEQDFNSLDAQREASEAYVKSQAHEGWRLVRDRYDDGGFSGGSMHRPALQKLLIDGERRPAGQRGLGHDDPGDRRSVEIRRLWPVGRRLG